MMINPSQTTPKARAVSYTIFTPTYNRAHTLPQLYASIRRQTVRDFEWVIVDDGSIDGTENPEERLFDVRRANG